MTRTRLDDLVARLQTVHDEELEPESGSADAEALFARIVARIDDTPGAEQVQGQRRRGRRWLLAAAAAVVVATGVTLQTFDIGPSPDVVTPAAAALREAAGAARAQDGVPPGAYLYVHSVNATLAFGNDGPTRDCCEALVPHVRELWLGDGPGEARLRERRAGELEFLSREERERWLRLGRPELDAKTPFSGILAGIPPSAWYQGRLELPSDADAVYARFEQDAESDTREPGVPLDVQIRTAMFHHFGDVLREARATPEQRAAAYEALARVPGLTLLGEVTDHRGRTGVAVALEVVENEPTGFLYRYVLVFDPETAALLEERREVLPGNRYRGLPAGTIEAYATYEYAVVGALGERPSAR